MQIYELDDQLCLFDLGSSCGKTFPVHSQAASPRARTSTSFWRRSDGAREYMGESRIEAIADAANQRIQRVQELSMTQKHTQMDSVADDVMKDIAEDYMPKMTM